MVARKMEVQAELFEEGLINLGIDFETWKRRSGYKDESMIAALKISHLPNLASKEGLNFLKERMCCPAGQ